MRGPLRAQASVCRLCRARGGSETPLERGATEHARRRQLGEIWHETLLSLRDAHEQGHACLQTARLNR